MDGGDLVGVFLLSDCFSRKQNSAAAKPFFGFAERKRLILG
jgi:hypothetical protein